MTDGLAFFLMKRWKSKQNKNIAKSVYAYKLKVRIILISVWFIQFTLDFIYRINDFDTHNQHNLISLWFENVFKKIPVNSSLQL